MVVKSFLDMVHRIAMNIQAIDEKPAHEQAFVEAARLRLENATSCCDAREGVREIVANLIGSEKMAIFAIDYSKAIMRQSWSHGVDCRLSDPVDLIPYPELYRALQGEILTFASPAHIGCFREPVSAIVPIPLMEVPAGLLVLFGILPQKDGLTGTDREVLQVVSRAAIRAISDESSSSGESE